MQSLSRNIGSAIGVSVTSFTLTRGVQATHADIAAGITPFDRTLQMGDAASRMLNPATRHGAVMLDQMIDHQARIIAYNNDYRLMMLTIVPPLLLLGFMRRHIRPAPAE
jgi:DHA2 family multidrug resistance protein